MNSRQDLVLSDLTEPRNHKTDDQHRLVHHKAQIVVVFTPEGTRTLTFSWKSAQMNQSADAKELQQKVEATGAKDFPNDVDEVWWIKPYE